MRHMPCVTGAGHLAALMTHLHESQDGLMAGVVNCKHMPTASFADLTACEQRKASAVTWISSRTQGRRDVPATCRRPLERASQIGRPQLVVFLRFGATHGPREAYTAIEARIHFISRHRILLYCEKPFSLWQLAAGLVKHKLTAHIE